MALFRKSSFFGTLSWRDFLPRGVIHMKSVGTSIYVVYKSGIPLLGLKQNFHIAVIQESHRWKLPLFRVLCSRMYNLLSPYIWVSFGNQILSNSLWIFPVNLENQIFGNHKFSRIWTSGKPHSFDDFNILLRKSLVLHVYTSVPIFPQVYHRYTAISMWHP